MKLMNIYSDVKRSLTWKIKMLLFLTSVSKVFNDKCVDAVSQKHQLENIGK